MVFIPYWEKTVSMNTRDSEMSKTERKYCFNFYHVSGRRQSLCLSLKQAELVGELHKH